jgi:hypothetical protein
LERSCWDSLFVRENVQQDALLEQAAMSAASWQPHLVECFFILVVLVIANCRAGFEEYYLVLTFLINNTALFGYLMKLTVGRVPEFRQRQSWVGWGIRQNSDDSVEDTSRDSSRHPALVPTCRYGQNQYVGMHRRSTTKLMAGTWKG